MYVPSELDVLQVRVGFEEIAHVEKRDLTHDRLVKTSELRVRSPLLPQFARRADERVVRDRRHDVDGRQFEPDDGLFAEWRVGDLRLARDVVGQRRPIEDQLEVGLDALAVTRRQPCPKRLDLLVVRGDPGRHVYHLA
ncbi:hypothetical protein, partial [Pseudonocardia asaccharolytica]|uniref:hypothetical protein n=1 Tax=Pseudonocardia asaccharolytica TaxID=54010 RepID=UPI001C99FBA8